MTMKQSKQKRATAGKPPLSDAQKSVKVLITVTPAQREKLKSLGGSGWVRAQIDGASPRLGTP